MWIAFPGGEQLEDICGPNLRVRISNSSLRGAMYTNDSLQRETQEIREELLKVVLASLDARTSSAAINIRGELESALRQVGRLDFSVQSSGIDQLRFFELIEEELDWAALAASPSRDLALEEI